MHHIDLLVLCCAVVPLPSTSMSQHFFIKSDQKCLHLTGCMGHMHMQVQQHNVARDMGNVHDNTHNGVAWCVCGLIPQ